MRLIRFDVELRGNKDVLLNDHVLEDPKARGMIEEKIITKNLTLDQQWALITSLKRLSAQLEDCYRQSRLRAGGGPRTCLSGFISGVPGTSIKKLTHPGDK